MGWGGFGLQSTAYRLQWSNSNKHEILQTTRQSRIYWYICIVTVYIVVHHFLQSYNLQKVKLSICYDRCEVGVDNKLIDWF